MKIRLDEQNIRYRTMRRVTIDAAAEPEASIPVTGNGTDGAKRNNFTKIAAPPWNEPALISYESSVP